MAEYPLLVFPEPAHAERSKRFGGGAGLRTPAARQQSERLTPQFQRLQVALDQKRMALQDNPLGLRPEQVLVLETVGSIENLVRAATRIGLTWLGEVEREPFPPEYGFEDLKDPRKELNGQLFLAMTDQLAQQQLLSYFDQWRDYPERSFPRGLARLKEIFAHLHTVRTWDAEDRLRETGVLEDWQDRVESGQEIVPFEVELWFREDPERLRQAESHVRSIIESLDGEVVSRCVISAIAYHGILARLPVARIREVVELPDVRQDVRLLQCESIRHIRPVGQCAVRWPEDIRDGDIGNAEPGTDQPAGEPIVALLDGLPLAAHQLLKGRIAIDDPDGYEADYPASARRHGTAMASLIGHGDLNAAEAPASRPIYARPIMKPRYDFSGDPVESIPEDVLPVDLIHRTVRRLYEPEGEQPPAAPSIRVINLSIGDPARLFDREVSSLARLLDWLAHRYNVLFIVSAGNHLDDIQLDIARNEFPALTPTQREEAVIKAVARDTRNRRLLSPGETVNGLTIGATHQDLATDLPPNLVDPFVGSGLPSIVNAHGPGFRRAIKPDIMLPGGRQFLSEKLGNTHQWATLQGRRYSGPPGQRVAFPGQPGELNRESHTRGTSNAAALASRGAMLLYDVVERLRTEGGERLPAEYDAVLLETMLVHGSSWGDSFQRYSAALKNDQKGRGFKEYLGRFLGYGQADISKVVACTEQRVTVLGVGRLEDGEGDVFSFPLPPSLAAETGRRRLTITLSWLTPLNFGSQKYRVAHLWFNPKNRIAPHRLESDGSAVQRGTVQHEILEGSRAVVYQDGEAVLIKVNCRAHAGRIERPVRYALAATLEVGEDIDIPVYQEVQTRLVARSRVPAL